MDDVFLNISGVGVIITIITTLLFNGVVIVAYIMMSKDMQARTANRFLLNQSIADICSVIPSAIWLFFAFGSGYNHLDQYYKILFLYTSFVIIGSIMVTTLDRFIYVKFPLQYQKMEGPYQLIVPIAMAWLLSIIPAVIYNATVSNREEEFQFARVVFSFLALAVFVIVVLLFFTFLYLRSAVRQRIDDIAESPLSPPERKDEELSEEQAKERRIIIILFFMVIAYAVTILPHKVIVLLGLHYHELGLPYSINYWQRITYMIYTLSASVDPLLTIYLRYDFRRGLERGRIGRRDGDVLCSQDDATHVSTTM